MSLRTRLYIFGFLLALAVSVAIVAYNMYGALSLTSIPPGRMSVLSFIGLKDLQRGSFTTEAAKAPAILAYILASAGVRDLTAVKEAALLSLAALPLTGGLFGYVATKSKLVGGASAILLSLLPISYLPALGGDYTLVSTIILVQLASLTALLFLRTERFVSALVWLALSSATAELIGLSMVSAAYLLLVITAAWAVWSLLLGRGTKRMLVVAPGIVAVAVNVALARGNYDEAIRLVSSISSIPQYGPLLGLLGVAGAAGSAALWYRMSWDSVPVLTFAVAGIILVPIFGWEALALAFPGIVFLAMEPLVFVTKTTRVMKEIGLPGREGVVVEVDFEKAVAVGLALITLGSPFVFGLGPGSAFQGANYLGPEELSTISQVQALSPSVFGQGWVAAPSSVAPWLRAELGVNTLPALTPNESDIADAITSTSFRLRSAYMMADEWTPFSSARSPFIYAFDGSTYAAVMHIDDGESTVSLLGGQNDTAKSVLIGHSFSQNSSEMTLTLRLSKWDFNTTKVITLYKDVPRMTVSYLIKANEAVPVSMVLPLFIEGQQRIVENVSGDTINLTMTSSNATLSFPGGTTPVLSGGPQSRVESTFLGSQGVINATVAIAVTSAKDSGMTPLYASLLDEIENQGVSNLLTFASSPGLNFLSNSIPPAQVIDVKDSFNRVLLTLNGTNYIESPAYAQVLSQSVSNSSCDASVSYKTSGLNIQKVTKASNDTLSLSYAIQPAKKGVSLEEMNVTLWVPFGRTVLSYGVSGNSAVIRLDSGPITIQATSGHLVGFDIGPDPVYGQFRAVLHFSLNHASDTVGVSLNVGRQVSCEQILAPRPITSGSDELQAYTDYGLVKLVFSNDVFTIYAVTLQEAAIEAP